MAIETLAALSGASSANRVPLSIQISAMRPSDRSPWRFSDDWSRASDRIAVMTLLAARIGLDLTTTVGTPLHGRSIELELEG